MLCVNVPFGAAVRNWILEADIGAFFEHVGHDPIVKVLEHHQMPTCVILYCRRWLQAPMLSEMGLLQERGRRQMPPVGINSISI